MFKRKKLWIIPVIVAIVAVTGVFAVPSAMPGAEQNGVALAAEEEPSPPLPSLREKPLGPFAVVNGKEIPIREGTVLGKVGSFIGPVVIGVRCDDYHKWGGVKVAADVDGNLGNR
jgi:hypothetical protein